MLQPPSETETWVLEYSVRWSKDRVTPMKASLQLPITHFIGIRIDSFEWAALQSGEVITLMTPLNP